MILLQDRARNVLNLEPLKTRADIVHSDMMLTQGLLTLGAVVIAGSLVCSEREKGNNYFHPLGREEMARDCKGVQYKQPKSSLAV